MPKYLVHFAQFHPEFRLPELLSLGVLCSIEIGYNPKEYSDDCPFLVIELANDSDAIRLIKRAILVKEIIALWASAETKEELFVSMKAGTDMHKEYYQTCSFKFKVDAFGYSMPMNEQLQRIESFAWMNYQGPIDLKTPDVVFTYFEDYSNQKGTGKKIEQPARMVYFGVLLAEGNRSLVSQYDLKKRNYLGTTSMDAELSLVMANQALARPGTVILDPFVGTGSFLVSCSHFGAYTMGADIDGRQIRGVQGKGIEANLDQYKLKSLVLGTLISDIAHHPWRDGCWFDAIVCDPPYGVRAGAKKQVATDKSPYKKYPVTNQQWRTKVPNHRRV